jgi:N-acetylglutamate synthase
MCADTILVRRLEELCFNAWPALRTVLVGGWVVRLAEGHERRANGASPIHPSFLPAGTIIDRVDDLFMRAGIEPVYRLTGLQPPEFEPSLRARGYVDHEPFVVLHLSSLTDGRTDPRVTIESKLSDRWLSAALAAYGWETAIEPGLRRVFEDIVWPCGFATVHGAGRDVAWGLAVAEADYVGLFDLVVAPDHRGKGYGRMLVRSLLDWGRNLGAGGAYLQVRTDNAIARALYRSLDFTEVYGCTHFVRPPLERVAPQA